MATIVLSAVGAAAGGSLGGGILGVGAGVLGRAAGATLGRIVDQSVLGAGSDPVETGRVDRFRLTGAGEGAGIARMHGRMRVSGQVIWASRFAESAETSGGGKGAPSQPAVTQFSYTVSLAIGLCEGVVSRVGRVWADGTEIPRDWLTLRIYDGAADQQPDPRIVAVEGAAPAYRGLAYVVIEDLDLGRFGNRVPQFSFEVVRPAPAAQVQTRGLTDVARAVRAVAMMPGTGEYALATTPVHLSTGPGEGVSVNVNTPLGGTDFAASLDVLRDEAPNVGSVSLIVSWFGDDLRCGDCRIAPKVEQRAFDGQGMPWSVSGVSRAQADTIPTLDGNVIYGGTPTDRSVVEAIVAMRDGGQDVVFYPFILMEQLAGNGRRDPYTGAADQPPLPWRGRITLSVAPGRPASPDGTATADAQVAAFFGAASPADFTPTADGVRYDGPPDFGYRRFILHYAHLCAAAGGVGAFCIGSEMRGLTTIRGAAGFPAVAALRVLAAECRTILGPSAKIGYAADWSEYFGHHPQDGSGDVFFHLDPLWADPAIDFVGIDNYMPLSDWRDGDSHADAAWGSIHDLDYLTANVAGGEGFDWYYRNSADEAAQVRTPITDGAHGEDWVYRYKDIRAWWSNRHHDRQGGTRSATPTPWVPQSKPVWFTEIGCAAIDKGANEPNKFLDPKSSESFLPRYSNGQRDDAMQMQYLRATFDHWDDPANNPASTRYAGRMVDTARTHVWAWDARPWPWFPGNDALWTDAPNHARGHWITGRIANRSLASVVDEICAASGVADADVSRLTGVVRGYALDEVGDARAALQPLMMAHGFDAIEREGMLIFRPRDGRAAATITADAVAVVGDTDLEATRTPEAARVGRVRLNHIAESGDFGAAAAEAVFPDERTFGVATTDLPMVLTRPEARAIGERWLAEARVARDRLRFALPPSRLALGAGDVVAMEGAHWRIDHVEDTGPLLIDAVRVEAGLYDRAGGVEIGLAMPAHVAPVPVLPLFLDLPLMRGDEVPHAPHVAAAARPWPGSVAVRSSATGSDYRLDTLLPVAATVGITQTALAAAPPGLIDRGAPLRLRLIGGTLASVDRARLLSGANAVAIGTGTDDMWEIFQFEQALLVGPRTWELRTRLRGQAGTDGVMPPVWPAGSVVVLLDGALRQIDLPPSSRGVARHYRVGPADRAVDDPVHVDALRAFDGIGLRPYAPVHLRAARDAGGLILSWTRRTRIDGDPWTGADVPLGEDAESYLLRVRQGGAIRRAATVPTPSWRYTDATRLADGLTGAFTVEVAQISARFGPGPVVRLDVPA